MDGAHVVVTGGAGFLGSALCEELLSAGAFVTCVDDESTGLLANLARVRSDPRLRVLTADVAELDAYRSRVERDGVDVVMHLAAIASPVSYLRMPLHTLRGGSTGTLRALDLAADHGARFVLASTSEVYGDAEVSPQPEAYWGRVNPIGPRAVYDESKRFAEAAAFGYRRARELDVGVVRIFNTYGPRMRIDDGRVIPTFLAQAFRGEPLTVQGDGRQTRSFCYVDDTVRALVVMALSDEPGPVNVGNPHEITMLELADAVLSVTGSSSPVRHLPLPQDDPVRRCPDVTRAREVLGWAPRVGLDEGLRQTAAWVRSRLDGQVTEARPVPSMPAPRRPTTAGQPVRRLLPSPPPDV
ncbi:NAD-dependent epimerase/dehydratase family protein [Mumia zhuanghuii]|uniref:NAD-dependent epimerase/dehydratase family protein n=1 Tax=Mumia zhuanghuii TaxID=2585211 RepID=A0A5C4MRK8_9ACTN|nr:NAD-dependent epimerase/dehydratase family protein [Mumia zhuanghuii]TNC46410.1 NAD-dependent epimerase/dehydratase family protein [Mumia zhuanghuii]